MLRMNFEKMLRHLKMFRELRGRKLVYRIVENCPVGKKTKLAEWESLREVEAKLSALSVRSNCPNTLAPFIKSLTIPEKQKGLFLVVHTWVGGLSRASPAHCRYPADCSKSYIYINEAVPIGIIMIAIIKLSGHSAGAAWNIKCKIDSLDQGWRWLGVT